MPRPLIPPGPSCPPPTLSRRLSTIPVSIYRSIYLSIRPRGTSLEEISRCAAASGGQNEKSATYQMCGDKRSREPWLNSATGHSQRSGDVGLSLSISLTHPLSTSSRHSCSAPSSDAFHYVPLCPIYSFRCATFVVRDEIRARDTVTKETSARARRANAASPRLSFIISVFLFPLHFGFVGRVAGVSFYRLTCLFCVY